jgi:hypothetical protein
MIGCKCIADKEKAMLEDLKKGSETWEAERLHPIHSKIFIGTTITVVAS